MTAASQESTWLQSNAQQTFLSGSDFRFGHDGSRTSQFHCRSIDNCATTVDPDAASNSSSSAVYSLSDISLTSSSCSEKDVTGAEVSPSETKVSSEFLFLPPCSSTCRENAAADLAFQPSYSTPCSPDSGSECLPCCDDDTDTNETNIDKDWRPMSSGSGHSIPSQMFDVVSMRDKLEAQREYLIGSFKRQSGLPQALTTRPKYPPVEKPTSLKMKEKLHKFGRATQRFWNSKILRRHPAAQRCEIQLQGFGDGVERLILIINCHKEPGTETLHVYMPSVASLFESDRVVLPKFLLPNSSGERMTVSAYGIAVQNNNQLPIFSEVVISGVCTIYSGSTLMTGQVELQPHRPCHSLIGHSKALQSSGSSVDTSYSGNNSYSFSTLPTPVARHFTELCVLQTANPFHEYFAMSSSSCDHPATFTAQLAPGNYHAVCSYRLTNGPVAGTFPVDSATPAAFFTAYTDKASVADDLKVAADMEVQVSRKGPLLLRSLPLLKLPGFNLEALMTTLRTGRNNTATKAQSAAGDVDTPDKALHICACDMVATQQNHKKATQANNLLVESMMEMSGSSSSPPPTTTNPRLSTGNLEYVLLPPLSVFNMGVSLYFANSWSYYDKHYVTLVLCKKGSPCQQVCKRNFHKLDPYNNPFLYRKRYYDPEPGVAVYASGNVNVEVVYSNSDTIQQLISSCSENVYFSKVQVGGV